MIDWINRLVFAAWIPSSAEIGRRVRLGYWGLGVVIHARCRIGDDCLISQNVTLGGKAGQNGVPSIGRGVQIGAGACILGGVTLGDRAVVGANSVVTTDVPPCTVVVGVPARVLRVLSSESST